MHKLHIKNRTMWDGRALRKLCLRTMKNKGTTRHNMVIDYSNGGYHGRAVINGNWIKMFVPRHDLPRIKYVPRANGRGYVRKQIPRTLVFNNLYFCQVLEHEIDHNLGLRHKDMADINRFSCDYAKGIWVAPLLPKPKPDPVQDRYLRALANLKKAKTRHKRATTLLKKWQKKVAYYHKKGVGKSILTSPLQK